MDVTKDIKDSLPRYVLITPAWNEAQFIERTVKSMLSQDVKPVKWVIVSDGSTDGTDDIVRSYTASIPWVELVRLPERAERDFAGKVHAFNAGYQKVRHLDYDIIGNLDADVSFEADHFKFLIEKFAEDPRLGVAGTAYLENSVAAYNYRLFNVNDVSGACQIFRRECFEDIGGYIPIKGGGIDLAAVYTARMKGWKTRTFTERSFTHNRRRGTGQSRVLHSYFRYGKQDYYLGTHPLWQCLRGIYQMKNKPYLLSGLFLLSGYLWGAVSRAKRPISPELVAFRREEQMQRLKTIVKGKLFFGKTT